LALIFPQYCFTCHNSLYKGEKYLCTQCIADLPRCSFHSEPENPVYHRLVNVKSMHMAMSYLKFIKSGKVQKLMHYYKYKNYPEIGTELGRWYGQDLREAGIGSDWDLIVPVPLHKDKLKKRGYNQSAYFARGLAESLQIDCNEDALVRLIYSRTQTRKSRVERWRNVEEIFAVAEPEAIQNKHILLVDDIITTGATLEACALKLEKCGVRAISVATIALAE
ncbi:MAG: ComF family protein, partial [Cyclobacteriaceae bacterium]